MLLGAAVLKDGGQGSRGVLGRGIRHGRAVLWRNRMAMLSTSSTATIPPHELRFFQVALRLKSLTYINTYDTYIVYIYTYAHTYAYIHTYVHSKDKH
jgi:hypothetical protein